jgi:hypothetical protein
MIRLEGISRTFDVGGESVHALVDVHETIAAGEYLAIRVPTAARTSSPGATWPASTRTS